MLRHAVIDGNLEVVQILVRAGANLEAVDSEV